MLDSPVADGKLDLYPYQVAAVEWLRLGAREGHLRQILCSPTGSGKSEIACHLIIEALKKNSRVAFVCDRRVLVRQTHLRFAKYGIPHGIAMSDSTYGRNELVQVCSAQTIEKRDYWSNLDILIIDEAHAQRKQILEFAKAWGGPVIGLTATPMTKGLGRWYSNVINVVTTQHLLSQVNPRTGRPYLAPLRIFPATAMDMTDAKSVGGEWTAKSVEAASSRIVGDVVSEWDRMTRQVFGGPVKTLLFTASVADGEDLCRAFQAAGHDFRQTTYRDSEAETEALITGFDRGDFLGLTSVSKLTKGFDVSDVLCGIDARPNKGSLAEVIQKQGRVMRDSEGKEFALWLDHAENILRWYDDIADFWADGVTVLDDGKTRLKTRSANVDRPDLVCGCGYVLPPGAPSCPACGRDRPRRRSTTQVVAGRISDEVYLDRPVDEAWAKDDSYVWQQVSRLALQHRRHDMQRARQTAGGYYKGITGYWPKRHRQLDPCAGSVDERVEKRVKYNNIRWRKSQERRAS